MHEAEKLSLNQIEAFLNASEEIRFEGENCEQVYGWMEQAQSRLIPGATVIERAMVTGTD